MICSGILAASGRFAAVEFDENRILAIHDTPDVHTDVHTDLYIAPGFIDLQVNGFAGVDFNRPDAAPADLTRAFHAIAATGVTHCLPTVITGPPDDMLACLRNLARNPHYIVAGYHVEGPHISAEDGPRGAHPLASVRPPDLREFTAWQQATGGRIRLVTLSPHWPESPQYIAAAVKAGTVVSIGHTAATADQIRAAVHAGATLSTHLGNAAHSVLAKNTNYILDQLAEDRLSASFIVDGIHLAPAFLQTALRAKQTPRAILVTDAAAPAGAPPGRYRLGNQDADLLADGRVVLASNPQRLAGSSLRMNDAIANTVRLGGVSLAEALRMATVNPARLLQIPHRTHGIAVGERADIVTFRMSGGTMQIEAVHRSKLA